MQKNTHIILYYIIYIYIYIYSLSIKEGVCNHKDILDSYLRRLYSMGF